MDVLGLSPSLDISTAKASDFAKIDEFIHSLGLVSCRSSGGIYGPNYSNRTILLEENQKPDSVMEKIKQYLAEMIVPKLGLEEEPEVVAEDEPMINNLMQEFLKKIQAEKDKKNPNFNGAIKKAEELYGVLINAITTYNDSKETKKDAATNTLIKACSAAIDEAKPLLEQELGWGAYLSNLLKSIVNAVISVTNRITGSGFTFFARTKAPMMFESEVAALEEAIQPKKS